MGSVARYANHHCDPNCMIDEWITQDGPVIVLVAIRNIGKEEELTFSYAKDQGFDCCCDIHSAARLLNVGEIERHNSNYSESHNTIDQIRSVDNVRKLRGEYGLGEVRNTPGVQIKELMPGQDTVSLTNDLNFIFNRVIGQINYILGKHNLGENDSFRINDVELSYGMFKRLYSKIWLDAWDIHFALKMIKRPAFVHLGYSIPFHEKGINGKGKYIKRPLSGWREKINNWSKGKNDLKQLYICPLNLYMNHFTTLEINERTKMIYHYDSLESSRNKHLVEQEVAVSLKTLGYNNNTNLYRIRLRTWVFNILRL